MQDMVEVVLSRYCMAIGGGVEADGSFAAELKSRIEKLEKGKVDTAAENAELGDRVTNSLDAGVVMNQCVNESSSGFTLVNTSSSSSCVREQKSLESKKTDAILDEVKRNTRYPFIYDNLFNLGLNVNLQQDFFESVEQNMNYQK
ncbi:hypothetical protein RCL_jg19389.t1 [Rhizophagus clarus]|uniref:Uncharacterized protein n=1 Tax=Rhizophagus clarus TaxID=94130 RepID=A0A8H3LY50_9GLOM|nr:hypothetical protein RCL_jg19389.t1 [Rhizophagus clarus]